MIGTHRPYAPGARNRPRDLQHRWRNCHRGKRSYPSRWRAWRHVITTCAHSRRIDLRLRPYRCRWKNNYLAPGGDNGPLHWHIGHANNTRRSRNRRTWLRVHVIWPYYRGRRWTRRQVTTRAEALAEYRNRVTKEDE